MMENKVLRSKSYLTLLLLLILGAALISGLYYLFAHSLNEKITELKEEEASLRADQEKLAEHQRRLDPLDDPISSEVMKYARMLPLQNELSSFLKELDLIVKATGVRLERVEIGDQISASANLPPSDEMMNLHTAIFGESSVPAVNQTEATNGETESDSEQEEELPLKEVSLRLDVQANEQQLVQLLAQIRNLDRIVSVVQLDYSYDKRTKKRIASLLLETFYYEEEIDVVQTP
jgi:Tfp pilus assembly protein PilO